MLVYRLLTGADDAGFSHRVSEALSRGWSLHGAPSLTFDSVGNLTVAGQAIEKEIDQPYSAGLDFTQL